MALFIFLGLLSGAPIWVLLIVVPLTGVLGYFGVRDSKSIDSFFKDF